MSFNHASRGATRLPGCFEPPTFAEHSEVRNLIPRYYWSDESRDDLVYHCNFWFLLDSLNEVNIALLSQLLDLETGAPITLATQVLYPAEVSFDETNISEVDDLDSITPSGAPPSRPPRILQHLNDSLQYVEFTERALSDLAAAPDDFQKQVIQLTLRLERREGSLDKLGVKFEHVKGTKDLLEFEPTGGGRLFLGTADSLVVFALSSQHPERNFYQRLVTRWKAYRARPS